MKKLSSSMLKCILQRELDTLTRKYFKEKLKTNGIVALTFASRSEIAALNCRYRKKRPKSTDILSFPSTTTCTDLMQCIRDAQYHDNDGDNVQVGEIVVCPQVVCRRLLAIQKVRSELVFRRKLQRLLVHGVAHLFHYDHHTWREYLQMRTFERGLMKLL